ncbi:threonine-phosphate decarboxylase CobD [Domibacillus indicus]|uniref:threonine-phosphate decarboxylase CobD n=1 Tax=Domibacillus indicus TaxID=1437523 RepID=UPI0006181A91|nr:threonine-phosphate decarboxylase CobD [Domibacillus indicus]
MNLPSHGANPAHLYDASGMVKPSSIIDFSVNTNPDGPPGWLKDKWPSFLELVEDYPDPSGQAAVNAIARRLALLPENILPGNGAAEIIHFIARHASGKKAVIVTPAFSEYEDACRAYGCMIDYVPVDVDSWVLPVETLEEKAKEAAVIFICTPNNPTGQVFQRKELIRLLEKTRAFGTIIVIDEAFYDFAGEDSIVSEIRPFPHLAVLHSMTKMYAVAGLRIGYIAASPEIITRLKRYRPHWNVNAIALQAAQEIASDTQYAARTRTWIREERERMMKEMKKIGFSVLPSSVNFYLLKDSSLDEQKLLLRFLLKRGIVLRHTENFHGLDGRWLRAAVKKEKENNQLLSALREWESQC